MGENADGCYQHYKDMDIPEVRVSDGVREEGGVRESWNAVCISFFLFHLFTENNAERFTLHTRLLH